MRGDAIRSLLSSFTSFLTPPACHASGLLCLRPAMPPACYASGLPSHRSRAPPDEYLTNVRLLADRLSSCEAQRLAQRIDWLAGVSGMLRICDGFAVPHAPAISLERVTERPHVSSLATQPHHRVSRADRPTDRRPEPGRPGGAASMAMLAPAAHSC
jgi:hypothetical protein